MLAILQGRVDYVIGALKQMATKRNLKGGRLKAVNKAISYYTNNREGMRYDIYLRQDYPIGSGVAEGACRHLVKDRMERTGMRWTLEGAQAMLDLRATYINGHWEEFHAFRKNRVEDGYKDHLASVRRPNIPRRKAG